MLFVTHDLEEAIALADRVVIMSAGPHARIIGDHAIDLPRPRDASEVRLTPRFHALHKAIWGELRAEVMKATRRSEAAEADPGRDQGSCRPAGARWPSWRSRIWHVGSSVPIGGALPAAQDSSSPRPQSCAWDAVCTTAPADRGQDSSNRSSRSVSPIPVRQDDVAAPLDHADRDVLAFVIGSVAGVVFGFWLARKPLVAAVFDPYMKMLNALPRVVLAPIFMLWLGLGIWSKVALGVTLVFFIVFFNVYQGVKEVSPTVLANARMLGMSERQLFAPRLLALGADLDVLLAAHLGGLRHHRRGGGRVSGLGRGPRLPDPRRRRASSTSPAFSPAWSSWPRSCW